MSVKERHYIIYGIKLTYSEYLNIFDIDNIEYTNEDIHDKYMINKNSKSGDLVLICDSMGSKYVIIGDLINASKTDFEGLAMTKITRDIFDHDIVERISTELNIEFKQDSFETGVFAFTHYS